VYIKYSSRLQTVFFIFFFFFLLISFRLIYIQIFKSSFFFNLAKRQQNLFLEIEPERGVIFDRNLKPQTQNLPSYSLYICPKEIKDRERLIRELKNILGLDKKFLRERISKDKYFIWIARKLSKDMKEKIERLNLEGIGFIKEKKRVYPNSSLGCHIIGYAGTDNKGLEGVELSYDDYLKGESGFALVLRDAKQKRLSIYEKLVLPKDGFDLVLTIDENIQYIVQSALEETCKKHNANSGSIIVMDPKTGEILALANWPGFDLNSTPKVSPAIRRNKALTDIFEPGSVFKIVTLASALEEKKFNEDDLIFCENGKYRVSNHILHDHKPHGWLTFRQVIEQSSNIGVTKIAQRLGSDVIFRYTKLFGFGDLSGIDLPGEVDGVNKEPKYWSKISIAAIPIGQEVGVTALQLTCAMSVIANDGILMKPYIIKRIQDKNGEIIKEFKPKALGQVISRQTALRMKEILQGVVERGTGRLARIKGYNVCGKTGTSQKLEPDGRYSHKKFFASFVGFLPKERPLISITCVIDEPKPYYFGGIVSAPLFKKVAEKAIEYLETYDTERFVSSQ